jgi:hypothetical protein
LYVNGKETTGRNRTTTRITFGCARNVIFLKGLNISSLLLFIFSIWICLGAYIGAELGAQIFKITNHKKTQEGKKA